MSLAWSGGEGTSSPGGNDRVRTPRLRASPSVSARQSLPATRHMSGSRASIARNITHNRAPESRAVSYPGPVHTNKQMGQIVGTTAVVLATYDGWYIYMI